MSKVPTSSEPVKEAAKMPLASFIKEYTRKVDDGVADFDNNGNPYVEGVCGMVTYITYTDKNGIRFENRNYDAEELLIARKKEKANLLGRGHI